MSEQGRKSSIDKDIRKHYMCIENLYHVVPLQLSIKTILP